MRIATKLAIVPIAMALSAKLSAQQTAVIIKRALPVVQPSRSRAGNWVLY
jgi:hypothetical protein